MIPVGFRKFVVNNSKEHHWDLMNKTRGTHGQVFGWTTWAVTTMNGIEIAELVYTQF